jgi:ABC-type Fe3+-hydroxamate transport system substrate-binding protein
VRRIAIVLLFALAGCAAPGYRTAVPPSQRRIVALMPSFVSDLISIGARRQIVGISSGNERVAAVRDVPIVADYESVDVERLVALRPDVVAAIPAQMRFLLPLRRLHVDVELLPDETYADIFTDLRRLGELSGRERAADAEIARLQRATAALRARAPHFARPPSVFVVIGTQPIWTAGAGSYIATLLALAGGRDAAGHLPIAYGEYSAEALLRAQPDAIVSDPSTQLASVLGREPWRSLRAVQRGHIYIVPNASLLERPGPQYVRGFAWLIATLRRLSPQSAEASRSRR